MPGFVVCAPAAEGVTASVAPCSDVEGVHHIPVVVQLPAPGQVHFDNANFLFSFGFVIIGTFFAVGYVAGLILSLIKHGQ